MGDLLQTAALTLLLMAASFGFVVLLVGLVVRSQRKGLEILSAERRAAIEKGQPLPPEAYLHPHVQGMKGPGNSLQMGYVFMGIGVGLSAALRVAVPAQHIDRCPACRKSWTEAVADTRRLTRALTTNPPAELREAVLAVHPGSLTRDTVAGPRVDWHILSWGLTGGALAASLTALLPDAPSMWPWAAFSLGTGWGMALAVLARLGIDCCPDLPGS